MELISVIVPVYNIERYVERCINSIVKQTYCNLEIILVDDGSMDMSGKICDAWKQNDSRIKVIHKENGGLSDARNAGIDAASGQYYVFIDGDDEIHVEMIQRLYDALIAVKAEISMCRIEKIESSRRFTTRTFESKEAYIELNSLDAVRKLLLDKMDCSACPKLYKKELFDNIRFPKGKTNEDFAVMYKIFITADKVVYMPDVLYFYFQREESITTTSFSIRQFDKYDNCIEMVEYIKNSMPEVINEAKFYLYRQTIYLLKTVCLKNLNEIYHDQFLKMRKTIIYGTRDILCCKWLPLKEKLMYLYIGFLPRIYRKCHSIK